MTTATRVVLDRRRVTSAKARPGHVYEMILTPSGWQHEDEGCPWWLNRRGWEQNKPCKHVIDLNKETEVSDTETLEGDPVTAVVTYGGTALKLYDAIDQFDAQLIVQGVSQERVEDWCYAFKQGSEVICDLSIKGVPAAVREMAKHGEVIRCDPPQILFENDNEIRMICTAHRFAVANGLEIEMDSATRALREGKKQKINDWGPDPKGGTYPDGNPKRVVVGHHFEEDEKWWEKAYSKAVRNATLPLIRDDCRSAIITAFKETPKYKEIAEGTPRRAPARAASSSPRQTSARSAAASQRSQPDANDAPEAPARMVEPTSSQLHNIPRLINEIKESWGAASKDFLAMRDELVATYGQEKLSKYALLTYDEAASLEAYLRKKNGEPDDAAPEPTHDDPRQD